MKKLISVTVRWKYIIEIKEDGKTSFDVRFPEIRFLQGDLFRKKRWNDQDWAKYALMAFKIKKGFETEQKDLEVIREYNE